jgi:catechol 2,3-dioxygenase
MLNARLSHVALRSADVAATRRFYEDHVGLALTEITADGRQRLGLGLGAHVLELSPGASIDHFALEIPDEAQLAVLLEELEARGAAVDWLEPSQDHPRALSFLDPDGHRIELHGRIDRSGEAMADTGRRPVRIHHVTLTAPDVPSLVDFYVSVLGFAISDRMGDAFAWLRCNREHHTVAIVEGPAGGLDHYCYEVSGWDDLKVWCDELAAGDVPLTWGPGRHGPGHNLFVFFDDPDGVHVEYSCEMERFWDDRVRYGEPRDWKQELRTVNLWGPTPDWRKPIEHDQVGR